VAISWTPADGRRKIGRFAAEFADGRLQVGGGWICRNWPFKMTPSCCPMCPKARQELSLSKIPSGISSPHMREFAHPRFGYFLFSFFIAMKYARARLSYRRRVCLSVGLSVCLSACPSVCLVMLVTNLTQATITFTSDYIHNYPSYLIDIL